MLFVDRADAGRHLAQRLRNLRGTDVAVLGLSRGGVPVAWEVAEDLRAPLDVIVVRKLGVPFSRNTASGRSVKPAPGPSMTTWCGRAG